MSSHLRNEIDVDEETKTYSMHILVRIYKNKEKNENPISVEADVEEQNLLFFYFGDIRVGSKCEIDGEILLSFEIGFVSVDGGRIWRLCYSRN